MNELLGRLRASLAAMAPRERLLVGACVGLFALAAVFFGIVRPALQAGVRAEQHVAAARQEMEAVRALRRRYDEVHTRLAAVEARVREGPRGEIFTTLEELARQSAVKVDSMEPRTSPASEEFRETRVQVALRGVTLAQIVGYLHKIESAPQLLSIKSLRIRTRADKPDLLDVTFSVSSFEPIS